MNDFQEQHSGVADSEVGIPTVEGVAPPVDNRPQVDVETEPGESLAREIETSDTPLQTAAQVDVDPGIAERKSAGQGIAEFHHGTDDQRPDIVAQNRARGDDVREQAAAARTAKDAELRAAGLRKESPQTVVDTDGGSPAETPAEPTGSEPGNETAGGGTTNETASKPDLVRKRTFSGDSDAPTVDETFELNRSDDAVAEKGDEAQKPAAETPNDTNTESGEPPTNSEPSDPIEAAFRAGQTPEEIIADSPDDLTVAEQGEIYNKHREHLQKERDALAEKPVDEIQDPEGKMFTGPDANVRAEKYRKQKLEQLDTQIAESNTKAGELENARDPKREDELQDKIKSGEANQEEIDEYYERIHNTDKREETPEDKQKEFEELAEVVASGKATEEQRAKYLELQGEINREKIDDLGQAWKNKAANGENPAEDLIKYTNELNKLNGKDPLTPREMEDFRNFMKEVYEGGVKLNPFEKSRLKGKFKELGEIEASLMALQKTLEEMKKNEATMKRDSRDAERKYMNAARQGSPDTMQLLQDYRTKALRLEGYQMAINDQAARGRQENIKRRQAVGYIHRKLGTHGLKDNILFGLGTLGYQMSDVFQDVTIDQVRHRFA